MYDESIIEISINEYEKMRDQLIEYHELLEQLTAIYESLSIDLVELGEVDLDEILEKASGLYTNE
jgi:CMP-2-keto-3-deoxyoctulosonic acid synthetase